MIADQVQELVLEHVGGLRQTRKGWKTRNCPLCVRRGEPPDRKKRFGIMFNGDGSIRTNCFNCGFAATFKPDKTFSAPFKEFMRAVGISLSDIHKIDFELFRIQCKSGSGKALTLRGAVTSKWTKKKLPTDAMSLKTWLDAGCDDPLFIKTIEYALGRNFTNLDSLYWTPNQATPLVMMNKRLILPFYHKGIIVGYTARYYGKPPTKDIPKYMNTMPSSFIYNLSEQFDYRKKYVILCEGVFDAYVTSAISPVGNTINKDQISLINNLQKTVIVCPDNDEPGDNLVKLALKQGWHVSFPSWRIVAKDAAAAAEKYGRVLTTQAIIEGAESNPLSIQLQWNINKNNRSVNGA